jgi:hypothetical protein
MTCLIIYMYIGSMKQGLQVEFFFFTSRLTVATLALGSQPRLRGCKVVGQKEGSSGIKAKALQGCGPRRSPGVTSQTSESVKKCEGVNPHIPKAIPTWEMESRWTSETSESDCRVKTQWLMAFFISLESS